MKQKDIRTNDFFARAVIALFLIALISEARAQENLKLLKTYDLGVSRYSEGLDYYDGFLWYTSSGDLSMLDPDSATDIDSDGDYDLFADLTWDFTHNDHSESSVWFEDELYNFTFFDSTGMLSDDIYTLDLNPDETYSWLHVGDGLGITNWGSCRDKRTPGESIIYTGHYDNLLMWYDPYTGNTPRTLVIPGLNEIEDLGMDRYGRVWSSSFDSSDYPGLYCIDPDTGEILGTFYGPDGLSIIDGIAIRSLGNHDVMYVTGKGTQYIWAYQVPPGTGIDDNKTDGVSVLKVASLGQNYPNPFNPTTTIVFDVPGESGEKELVKLSIYDTRGRCVKTLIDSERESGAHKIVWDGKNEQGKSVSSGIYLYTLSTKNAMLTKKMTVLR